MTDKCLKACTNVFTRSFGQKFDPARMESLVRTGDYVDKHGLNSDIDKYAEQLKSRSTDEAYLRTALVDRCFNEYNMSAYTI